MPYIYFKFLCHSRWKIPILMFMWHNKCMLLSHCTCTRPTLQKYSGIPLEILISCSSVQCWLTSSYYFIYTTTVRPILCPITDFSYNMRYLFAYFASEYYTKNIKTWPPHPHKLLEFVHHRFRENFCFLWLIIVCEIVKYLTANSSWMVDGL